jgi:hypothetical protein
MKLGACCIAILVAMMTAGEKRAQQQDPRGHSAGVTSVPKDR